MKKFEYIFLLMLCLSASRVFATSEQERFDILRGNFSCEEGEPLSRWSEIAQNYLLDLSFRKMDDNNLFVVTRFEDARKYKSTYGSDEYSFTEQIFQFDCERTRLKRLALVDTYSASISRRKSRDRRSERTCTTGSEVSHTATASQAAWIDFKQVLSINLQKVIEKVCK